MSADNPLTGPIPTWRMTPRLDDAPVADEPILVEVLAERGIPEAWGGEPKSAVTLVSGTVTNR